MSQKVLLVDDDPTLRSMTAHLLKVAGHDVSIAASGVEARAKLQKNSFDAVITDLVMPDMDGLELIREIRSTDRATFIVAISGGSINLDVDYLPYAKVFGANVVLKKPIMPTQLLDILSDWFDSKGKDARSTALPA